MIKKNIPRVISVAIFCVFILISMSACFRSSPSHTVSDWLNEFWPGGEFNDEPDKLRDDAPETVESVYTEKNGNGTVVILVTDEGYTGNDIRFAVAINPDGQIVKFEILQNNESIVPSELKPGGSYGDNYIGADSDDIADLVTGATVVYTELAIKSALEDAFTYLGYELTEPVEDPLPRDEYEIQSLAVDLFLGYSSTVYTSTPIDTDYVKRIYKKANSNGFVAYAYSLSQYGSPEFEILIYVNEEGEIAGIHKIMWKVSDPMPEYGFNPPADEVIDSFFNSFVGKDKLNADEVDLVSGVTSTSNNAKSAIIEALGFAKTRLPREKSEIDSLAKEFYGKESANLICTETDNGEFVRFIYRELGKLEYVAYAFSYSQYGSVEFEFLIHVGSDGTVKNIYKILWNVSDPMPEWGFYPPSDYAVQSFFNSFIGKSENSIDSVDVATGATHTSNQVKSAALEALNILKK